MEVVGGVASIITLIEATGVLAKVSRDLVLRWRNAPHEIQALATRLSLLAAELHSIKNATAKSHPVLTDAIIRQSLSDLLTDVRKRLAKLESLHLRLQQHGPTRQKVEWAAKASSVEKMLSKTQEVEQRLANLMTLISLKAQTPILEGLERIEQMVSTLVLSQQMVSTIVVPIPASAPVAPDISSTSTPASNGPPISGSRPAVKRSLVSAPWTTARSWEPWGLRGSIVTTQQGAEYQYDIRFSISLPLARILGGYALTGCLSLQSNTLCRNSLKFRHPSYFAVARAVEDQHPFTTACWTGDIRTVRSMLRSGEVRPSDVTANGRTPMFSAVESGNTEAIAELLDSGADIDAITSYSTMSTGLIQSSTNKDLDTVRFLLQRGASTDPMNYAGFGASAACWHQSDLRTRHPSMEIFDLLIENTCLDLDPSKTLCNASMQASSSQIDSLIGFGGDIHYNESIQWTPIHIAAFHGNLSAYSALVSHYDCNAFKNNMHFSQMLVITICGLFQHLKFVSEQSVCDPKGPREHDKIVIDMVQRGFDTRGRQYVKKYPWMPPGIGGMEMAADKLAKALGPDIEAWYLVVMFRCGLLSGREDAQRLRELTRAGHAVKGFAYDCGEEEDEAISDVHGECEENNEDLDCGENHGEVDIYADSTWSASSEAQEGDQFWDAEEDV